MGQKTALCIGIDQYGGSNQLSGCVNDARAWARFFEGSGFQVKLLLDGDATYNGILRSIEDAISQARAGDVVAVQYAGHGTRIPDTDGDEVDGEDEAIVPIDFSSSDVIVDDVLGPVFDRAANGAGVYVFFDCCHSGGATRLLSPPTLISRGSRDQVKVRFMPPTEAMIARHRERQRELRRGSRGVIESDPRMREVLFAACQPSEVSLETNGHGMFTTAALSILQNGFAGLTNSTFIQNVVAVLGSSRQQTPQLSCADGMQNLPLFSLATGGPSGPVSPSTLDDVIKALKEIARGSAAPAPTAPASASSNSMEDLVAGLNAIAAAGKSLRRSN